MSKSDLASPIALCWACHHLKRDGSLQLQGVTGFTAQLPLSKKEKKRFHKPTRCLSECNYLLFFEFLITKDKANLPCQSGDVHDRTTGRASVSNSHPTRHILLGGVDPDDIQVAVVDALFVLVRVTCAALGSGLCLCGPWHLRASGAPGARHPAGDQETTGVELRCNQGIENTLQCKNRRIGKKRGDRNKQLWTIKVAWLYPVN